MMSAPHKLAVWHGAVCYTAQACSNEGLAADETLWPMQVEDSDVCPHFASAASLSYDGLAVDHALLPLGIEDSKIPHHISSEAAELMQCSCPRDKLDHSRSPAAAEDTELEAVFASKVNVPSANVLNEGYGRLASMGMFESAMPLEPAWLAEREPATSPLDNTSPDTNDVNRLFARDATSKQVQHDSWANCDNLASSNVPDLHELFRGRGHQIASMRASADADSYAAWADEPNTQLNRTKSDFW